MEPLESPASTPTPTTFEALLAPIAAPLAEMAPTIDAQAHSRTLFFIPFVRVLLYAIVMRISSLRQLVTELETSPTAAALKLHASVQSVLSREPGVVLPALNLRLAAAATQTGLCHTGRRRNRRRSGPGPGRNRPQGQRPSRSLLVSRRHWGEAPPLREDRLSLAPPVAELSGTTVGAAHYSCLGGWIATYGPFNIAILQIIFK